MNLESWKCPVGFTNLGIFIQSVDYLMLSFLRMTNDRKQVIQNHCSYKELGLCAVWISGHFHLLIFFQESKLYLFCLLSIISCACIIIIVTWQVTVQEKVGSCWWRLKESNTYVRSSCTSHIAPGTLNTYISNAQLRSGSWNPAKVRDRSEGSGTLGWV